MLDHAKNSEHNNQIKEFTNYLHLYYLHESVGKESVQKIIYKKDGFDDLKTVFLTDDEVLKKFDFIDDDEEKKQHIKKTLTSMNKVAGYLYWADLAKLPLKLTDYKKAVQLSEVV